MDLLAKINPKGFLRNYNKRRFPVVAELISSEEEYVNVLEKVVCGYMSEFYNQNSKIPPPEVLRKYSGHVIFGNISEIYEWHKYYFLRALKENQHSVRELSKIFTQNDHHFHMYSKFALSKPTSEYLISTNFTYFNEIKNKLELKNNIEDFMIAPIQRVTRYKLLLTVFLEHLKENGLFDDMDYLVKACNMIKAVCAEVNEFTVLNGIKNFDGLLSAQGKLLHHGFLNCDYDGKQINFYVFLFKCSILFTEKQVSKGNNLIPNYNFRFLIAVNNLQLKELANSKFSLQLTDPKVPSCKVICEGNTKEEHIKWKHSIRQLLAEQMDLIHNLVHPSDNNEREALV